jgi:superfamily II DNA/RNA helicase
MDFTDLGLNPKIAQGLSHQAIHTPTPIQQLAIPAILTKRDVILQSETGSGKTLAYMTAVFEQSNVDLHATQAIILVPTQELAMQVFRQAKSLAADSAIPLSAVLLFGDVNIKNQIAQLKLKPHIVIGTTGRILQLIRLKKLSAHNVSKIVIDEADKLLGKTMLDDVKAIVKSAMRDTQIIMASPGIPERTAAAALEVVKSPLLIKTDDSPRIPAQILHRYILCRHRDKTEILRKLLHSVKPRRAIVFLNDANQAQIEAAKLIYHKMPAAALTGEKSKEERKEIMGNFIQGRCSLLTATDLAARGLDIEGVDLIVSVDIPEDATDYLHRCGRTGRAAAEGMSVLIVAEQELPFIKKLQSAFAIEVKEISMREGKIKEAANRPIAAQRKKPPDSKK